MGTSITVTLRRSASRLNPQDLSAITCWCGTTQLGTPNEMLTITQSSDIRSGAGYSPTCSAVAETIAVGGAPVYLCSSAIDMVGTVAAVVKTPASEGVAYNVYGSKLVAGSTTDGDIRYQGLVLGASLTITVGTLAASVAPGTNDVSLAIPNATAASAVETFWLSADAGATAARAKVSATFLGTKATNAGNTLAQTFFNNGGVSYTPPATGYRVKHTNTGGVGSTTASYSTLDLTVALGTDAAGNPNDPVSDLVTAVNAIAGKIVAAPIGDGTGNPGLLPSFQALQYGSTAAMTITGDPTDYLPNIHVVCSTAGALGTAQVRWTIDGQDETLSAPVLVPGSGIVTLTGSNLDTGLSAVFTGVLEAGDYWDSSATPPTSNTASLVAAVTAALDDPTRKFGVVAIAQPLTLSQVQQIDSLIQSKWGKKFDEALVAVRDRNISNGAYTETDAQYVVAVNSEFLAFSSEHGLTDLIPAGFVFPDGYTGYTYGVPAYNGDVTLGRPCVFAAVARNSAIPVHESLGRVASGKIRNCQGISHDERTAPGLFDRFIVTQTYDERPGQQFFSGASTTADPSDPAYTREPWVSLACQVGRIAAEAAFIYIGDTVATVAVPENNGAVPIGALTATQARLIEDVVTKPIEDFLFKPKTDGRPSAERLPAVDSSGAPLQTVTALRNYDAKSAKQLRLEVLFNREGIIESIVIGINLL